MPGMFHRLAVVTAAITLTAGTLPPAHARDQTYAEQLAAAGPDLHWSFQGGTTDELEGRLRQEPATVAPTVRAVGPGNDEFPLMEPHSESLILNGRSWLTFDDPGADSVADFAAGDAMSVEAWVRVDLIDPGQQQYVIGKGRTNRKGQVQDNQNWAFRVRGINGRAHISFLFRSADDPTQEYRGEFHRWNSLDGFDADGSWHHVALSFTFGSDAEPRAWIDGAPTRGNWDMGGATFFRPPVVDDDQIWIGSSMGGNPGSSLVGAINRISIFRRCLSDQEIAQRFRTTRPPLMLAEIGERDLPAGTVLCEIRENVAEADPWNRDGTRITARWEQPHAALTALPRKYIRGGLIGDRSVPSVVRMRTRIKTPQATMQFLIRARSDARLLVDGREIASLQHQSHASDGHEEVRPPVPVLYERMHPVQLGDQEAVQEVLLAAGEHVVDFEALVGGRNMRLEISELLVAMGSPSETFVILSPLPVGIGIDERSWQAYAQQHAQRITLLEKAERLRQDAGVADYWNRRHELTAAMMAPLTTEAMSSELIDQMLAAVMQAQAVQPVDLVDDLTFLRRLALNTVGVIPLPAEIHWFLDQPAAQRRQLAIDRFLNDDRWGDHWVAYWQDVLAENPGILKPELNNTGPFRWWIHESFMDNKPTDRFATELIMMRGSRLGGGPAGFAMATQNDVPFAERALVISTAFNAREMKCARCHDSPVRSTTQQQVFELAAMLNRAPLKLPASSTVPPGPNGERSALITSSLQAGAVIAPQWPFADDRPFKASANRVWDELLRNPQDTREQAALHLTHASESRFAEVMVNRLWSRLFGHGLVRDADDWSATETVHGDLLHQLAIDHVRHGYDLKHTARLIMNSQAWQRAVAPPDSPVASLFGAQTMRRLSAEQLLDSLYAAVGKSFDAELLTLDPEGRRPITTFLNLGAPTRAWHFCSLSNERDRPALALPVAQSLIDLLAVFGWRDARPQTLSQRSEDATVLQPLTLANGNAGHRLIQLNDGAALTELAVTASSPEQLVDQILERILTRRATAREQTLLQAELSDGFSERVIPGAVAPVQPQVHRNLISWSNHLNARATELKQAEEQRARDGDPPSVRLTSEWRQRAEDVAWALLNSPEFVFLP